MDKNKELTVISKKKEYYIALFVLLLIIITQITSIKISADKNFPIIKIIKFQIFDYTFIFAQILSSILIYTLILPKFFDLSNWRKIFLSLFFSYLTFSSIRYLFEQILTKIIYNRVNYYGNPSFIFYFYDNIYYGSISIFLTILLWSIIHLFKTSQQNNIIEKEKKEAEINFLKSQINPHFLFNTLNNIYSLVSVNSPHSLKAIENLSAIMRFTTYETNKDKIEIEREIDYINQYLDLEQIRYGEKFYVEKEFLIENSKKLIHPYIISPLIENAIKHGVVKDSNHPIKINLRTNTEHLEISVSNKINQHQKDETSGIGLTNLKKRLNYYFGNNYSFEIKNDYVTFHIYLKIPLNDEN